jgi:uncharacterized protein YprB with RNaseH-like and TPR domain
VASSLQSATTRAEPDRLDPIDAALLGVQEREHDAPGTLGAAVGNHAQRLARLRAQLGWMQERAERPSVARAASVSREERERAQAEQRFREQASKLPGEARDTPHGSLRSVTTRYQEDHCHGSIPVALALESCARDLSVLALDPTLEQVDFARALYIDTETTGLSGGSGTLPFLIGMAWFEARELVVEQLLRHQASELHHQLQW